MCSIFQLVEGYTLPFDLLFNAVHNNEHGYGILLKDNKTKRIQLIKDMPKKVDPDHIYKLLKENEDVERWVHLRNCSAGDVHIDNVQPVPVYHSKKRDVFFMHNGTMYNVYLSSSIKALLDEDIEDKKYSDSYKFGMGKIAPLLARFKGADGDADISDPYFQYIMDKEWQTQFGKGVLISNNQDALLLNPNAWEKIKDKDGKEFLASNNDYFNLLKRGTLFDERKKEEEAKRNATFQNNSVQKSNLPSTTKNKTVNILECVPFENELGLGENILNILEEYDLYSPDGLISLGFIDHGELVKLFKDNVDDAATLFMWLTSYVKDAFEKREQLETKLENASKIIESLKRKKTEEIHVG